MVHPKSWCSWTNAYPKSMFSLICQGYLTIIANQPGFSLRFCSGSHFPTPKAAYLLGVDQTVWILMKLPWLPPRGHRRRRRSTPCLSRGMEGIPVVQHRGSVFWEIWVHEKTTRKKRTWHDTHISHPKTHPGVLAGKIPFKTPMCWVLVGDIVILRRKPGATFKSLRIRYVSPVPNCSCYIWGMISSCVLFHLPTPHNSK